MGCISVSGTASAARTKAWAASRGLGLVGAALLLVGASPVGRLDVAVSGLRSDKGLLRVCLTSDPQGFPKCHADARAVRRNVPADVRMVSFEGLPPGTYAAAALHDENGNKRLDTLAGIPREGFGFSRNPAIRFGPPRFDDARFAVSDDAGVQPVRMRYMF